ncbi:MAG: ribonuclease P protein component [Bacteroidia bacterium]|nr:ribonuclease P protein component [Bacteroidia bacterium]
MLKGAASSLLVLPSLESPISKYNLPRAERLRGRKTFQLLFHLAQVWEAAALRLYGVAFLINLQHPSLRVAFSVPKRVCRKAAHRHRIRRRLREAYRLEKASFLDTLPYGEVWLLWQWRTPEVPSVSYLRSQMQSLYKRFQLACYASSSSD